MALLPESWKTPRRSGRSTGDWDDGPSGEQPPHPHARALSSSSGSCPAALGFPYYPSFSSRGEMK